MITRTTFLAAHDAAEAANGLGCRSYVAIYQLTSPNL